MMMSTRPVILATTLGAIWLMVVFFFPAGLWVPDETVIFAAVEGLRRNGSLVIDNGYSEFGNHALLFNDLLKLGPHGPVSQYPTGYPALLVPFYAAGGLHGMMTVNAVSAALSVWLTYQISLTLFADRRGAFHAAILWGLCTYLVIYAKALWPHALAATIVLSASLFTLRAVRGIADERRNAAMAGLCLGLGLSVRVDVVLIAPTLLATALLFAARPGMLIAMATLGVLPGALVASWFNLTKFGIFFPIYYGSPSGGTALASYSILGAITLAFLMICIAFRRFPMSDKIGKYLLVLLCLGAVAFALLDLQYLEDRFTRLLRGVYTLWVDMRLLDDQSHQVTRAADGTVTVFGLHKKAVAQSMPWIGIIFLFLLFPRRHSQKSGQVFCLLAIVLWTLPFARSSWHGGFATNMRYFLPILPFVCILSSLALSRLPPVSRAASIGIWLLALALIAVAITAGLNIYQGSPQVLVQHALPLVFFAALIFFVGLARFGGVWPGVVRLFFSACICLGLVNTYAYDLAVDIKRRSYNARAESVMSALPPNSFIYALIYEPLTFQLSRDAPIAARNRFTKKIDPNLIDAARANGYTVYIQSNLLRDQVLAERPNFRAERVFEEAEWMMPVYRLKAREDSIDLQ
ncbi:hypothetical protein MGEO_19190 [Marivita geojedonensis]|uniref:Glycosyltransferase RgtA/B/C/D-like domain-containing protein n=2 Tax=Marivita geojedonensis TaxID=1123756 RepID=A0A1X4NC96_9RHOB|nr:hypothetical protein MGEO_19190 [Marivita geojedonensis]